MNTLQKSAIGLAAGSLLALAVTTTRAETLVVRPAVATVPATTAVDGDTSVFQPVIYRRWSYARPYGYGGWGPRYYAPYRAYYGPRYGGGYYYGPPRAYRYYGAPYGYYDYPYGGSVRVGDLRVYWR